jgi:hypothetical protein
MESAEGAWPTKGNASGSKVLCTHLIRRHLQHRLQGKQGPNVDTGTRNWMLRVVGDAAVWSIISKRTVTKIVGVGLTAGRASSRKLLHRHKEMRNSKPEGDTADSPRARLENGVDRELAICANAK